MTDLSVAKKLSPYKPKNKVRFVTAASLFDGHDASINIMRRILQSTGSEVIHLGHNRSVGEIVNAALQEDVQGICITSYQGGHVEYFKYMIDLLKANGGVYSKGPDWAPYVLTDGTLVTGQNPASSEQGAHALLKLLG